MKIKDVVRGVEEEKSYEADSRGTVNWNKGHNSLASAEVVVDREKIAFEIFKKISNFTPESAKIEWTGRHYRNKNKEDAVDLAQAIATAIESGSIISIKKEEK